MEAFLLVNLRILSLSGNVLPIRKHFLYYLYIPLDVPAWTFLANELVQSGPGWLLSLSVKIQGLPAEARHARLQLSCECTMLYPSIREYLNCFYFLPCE